MAFDYADFAISRKEKAEKKRQEHVFQLRQRQKTGQKISELIQDERWRSYSYHLETMKERYERQSEDLKSRLLGRQFLDAKEYGQAKLDQVAIKAKVEALDIALKLVEVLINRGEQAAKELMEEKVNAEAGRTLGSAG